MVARKESVITAERFATGKTYEQYRESIESYSKVADRFDHNYEGTDLSEEDVQAFKTIVSRPDGPAKVLIITEDWCPDCYREVPVMARIAEAGGMELRVLERDQNKDAMAEFLKNGEFESIPVFVFYTKDHRYIMHWIERSRFAEEEAPKMRATFQDLSQEERAAASAQYQRENWHTWRRATVDELKRLLADARPS
jgi:thiol-disulfide isomerase/thioredoxin